MKKRVLGLVLSFIIVISALPVMPVFAGEELFADDFEARNIGKCVISNSVYEKTAVWTSIPEGGEIIKFLSLPIPEKLRQILIFRNPLPLRQTV